MLKVEIGNGTTRCACSGGLDVVNFEITLLMHYPIK